MVVPGSARVRIEAEAEGIDKIVEEFGAEWRFAGCSMCLGMNPDQLAPGERCASTSQPQLRGPAGQGRSHAPGLAARRGGDRHSRHAVSPWDLDGRSNRLRSGDYASAAASGNAANRGARTLDVDPDYVDGVSEPGTASRTR